MARAKGAKSEKSAPSDKLQSMRTAKNKRLAPDRHAKRMAKKAAHRQAWESRQVMSRPISG